MDKEAEAKEVAVLEMLASYHTAERVTDDAYRIMLEEIAPYSLRAVILACKRFKGGKVEGHNNAFPPNSGQLTPVVERMEAMLQISVRPLQGIVEVDMGRGVIRTGHLTSAEVDYVLDRKGVLPDGRAMALLPADELKAEVSVAMKALPPPGRKLPTDIVPHLKRFADA
jgi:hypothetical protein